MNDIVGTYAVNGELITLENIHEHYKYIHAKPEGIKHYFEEMNGNCFAIAELIKNFYPNGEIAYVFMIGRTSSQENNMETLIPHAVLIEGDTVIDPITAAVPLYRETMEGAEYLIPIKKGKVTCVPTERMMIDKHEFRSKFDEKYLGVLAW